MKNLVDVVDPSTNNSLEGKSVEYNRWTKGCGMTWGEYERHWRTWCKAQAVLLARIRKERKNVKAKSL